MVCHLYTCTCRDYPVNYLSTLPRRSSTKRLCDADSESKTQTSAKVIGYKPAGPLMVLRYPLSFTQGALEASYRQHRALQLWHTDWATYVWLHLVINAAYNISLAVQRKLDTATIAYSIILVLYTAQVWYLPAQLQAKHRDVMTFAAGLGWYYSTAVMYRRLFWPVCRSGSSLANFLRALLAGSGLVAELFYAVVARQATYVLTPCQCPHACSALAHTQFAYHAFTSTNTHSLLLRSACKPTKQLHHTDLCYVHCHTAANA